MNLGEISLFKEFFSKLNPTCAKLSYPLFIIVLNNAKHADDI